MSDYIFCWYSFQFAPGAIRFYAVLAKRKRFHHIFASKAVLKHIFDRVIFPNIVFLASTKQLNSDPDEYIRIDMCEQAVSCLIEVLVENYENFSEIIGQEVGRCIKNTTKNVLSKRYAIFLATFRSKFDVEKFCASMIVPELSNSDSVLTVRLDALRFLSKYGSKKNIQSVLPYLQQYSKSVNKVESEYALGALKRWKKMLRPMEYLSELIKETLKTRRIKSPYLTKLSFADLKV